MRTGEEPLVREQAGVRPHNSLPPKGKPGTSHDISDREPSAMICLNLLESTAQGSPYPDTHSLIWRKNLPTSFSRTFFHWSISYMAAVSELHKI